MEPIKDAPPQPRGSQHIVLCLDSLEVSRCAAGFARRLATPDTKLTILSLALDPHEYASNTARSEPDRGMEHRELMERAERAITEASTVLAKSVAAVRSRVIDLAKEGDSVVHELAAEAGEDRAGLLILGIRQHHGLVRWFDPAVMDRLSRCATCALIVVPAGYESTYDAGVQRVLFAVDGSVTSLVAVGVGARFAAADTQIRVVYVVDRAICPGGLMPATPLELALVKEGTLAIAAAAKELECLHNVTPSLVSTALISTETGTDDIASATLREAQRCDADLIVMGTHGRRGGARAYLGSVPNRVASLVEIPLMLVRERHNV